ncbi:gluconate 2-dehydrogenase subunit 3 family protein [Frateuria aurantia]
MDRRKAIKSLAGMAAAGVSAAAGADVITSHSELPTQLSPELVPEMVTRKGGLSYLTQDEATTVGAIFDRLIPADALSIGAVDAGCVEFIDRQLAGDFGKAKSMYMLGPFKSGLPEAGPQTQQTPAQRYRIGLADLQDYLHRHGSKDFAALDAQAQDQMLQQLEAGAIEFAHTDAKAFFALLLQNVREGYFADPIYGGNKNMVGWKLVGFPGARYDFREQIARKGQVLNIEPVSLADINR